MPLPREIEFDTTLHVILTPEGRIFGWGGPLYGSAKDARGAATYWLGRSWRDIAADGWTIGKVRLCRAD